MLLFKRNRATVFLAILVILLVILYYSYPIAFPPQAVTKGYVRPLDFTALAASRQLAPAKNTFPLHILVLEKYQVKQGLILNLPAKPIYALTLMPSSYYFFNENKQLIASIADSCPEKLSGNPSILTVLNGWDNQVDYVNSFPKHYSNAWRDNEIALQLLSFNSDGSVTLQNNGNFKIGIGQEYVYEMEIRNLTGSITTYWVLRNHGPSFAYCK